MKTFKSANHAWVATMLDILKHGLPLQSRDGGCKELTGYAFKLSDIDFPLATVRGASTTYAAAETLWYLSGSDSIELVQAYAPQYSRFAQPGTDIAHGAYGARLQRSQAFVATADSFDTKYQSQLVAAIKLLREQPNTRQCILGFWDTGDLLHALKGDVRDIPCTVSLQFLLRDGQLHAVTYMRSNDIWLGMPYDVFAFTTFQRIVAEALEVEPGTYTHCVGSMHLYDRNTDQAVAALNENDRQEYEFKPKGLGNLQASLAYEEHQRKGTEAPVPPDPGTRSGPSIISISSPS